MPELPTSNAVRHPLIGLAVVGFGASLAPLDFAVNIGFPAITEAFALDTPAIRWVAISGFTDAGANALLVAAVRTGLLSVVAPVANLFPAVTVLLARAVGHEKIGRFRLTGLALAVVSLVLIAL